MSPPGGSVGSAPVVGGRQAPTDVVECTGRFHGEQRCNMIHNCTSANNNARATMRLLGTHRVSGVWNTELWECKNACHYSTICVPSSIILPHPAYPVKHPLPEPQDHAPRAASRRRQIVHAVPVHLPSAYAAVFDSAPHGHVARERQLGASMVQSLVSSADTAASRLLPSQRSIRLAGDLTPQVFSTERIEQHVLSLPVRIPPCCRCAGWHVVIPRTG